MRGLLKLALDDDMVCLTESFFFSYLHHNKRGNNKINRNIC
jgi:hypothetical protein